jgi:hypothetical protein
MLNMSAETEHVGIFVASGGGNTKIFKIAKLH